MEDAIAEESYLLLAATVGRASQAEPTLAEVLPVRPLPMPVLAPGENSGAALVAEPAVVVGRSRSRIVVGFNKSDDGSLHHTVLPRTMVIAALLAALGSPLVAFVLERQGHLVVDGTDWQFDDHGRSIATAAVVAVIACAVLGWLWWTTAAALNARKKARYTVSPIFAPLLILVMFGCTVLLVVTLRTDSFGDDERTRKAVVIAALIVIAVVSHFAILEAYRRAARGIGGSQRPWSFVILLPWATLAANLLAQFFARTVGASYSKVTALGNMFVFGVLVLALYQAMSSFDRACSGRHMAHNDRGELPDFLRSR